MEEKKYLAEGGNLLEGGDSISALVLLICRDFVTYFSNMLRNVVTKVIADALFWQLPIFSPVKLGSNDTDLYNEEN